MKKKAKYCCYLRSCKAMSINPDFTFENSCKNCAWNITDPKEREELEKLLIVLKGSDSVYE